MRQPRPCWPEDDRYADVKRQLSVLMGRTHRGPAKQWVPDGLTRVETMVLVVLDDLLASGAAVHPGTLAHATHSTPSSLSQTLKGLEGKGLIERQRGGGGDFRSVAVSLTPAGELQVREAQRLHNEGISALLDYLGEDDVTELLRILNRIAEHQASRDSAEEGGRQ